MTVRDELRRRWFVTTISIIASLFFVFALAISAASYVSVMDAKQRVELKDAVEGVRVLQNGSIEISLTVTMVNPSREEITMSSISWNVKVVNATASGLIISHIPLLSQYGVPGEYSRLGPRAEMTLEFSEVVSDQSKIANLEGFIDHWSSQGVAFTLLTLPYLHDLRVLGWLGDYKHDYQYSEENYLNDMVRIDERYVGGVYL